MLQRHTRNGESRRGWHYWDEQGLDCGCPCTLYERFWTSSQGTLGPKCGFPSESSMGLVVVQSLSHVQLFVTPRTAVCQASLCFTISLSLLKLISIESVMPSNHFILCCPLLLLPSIFPIIKVLFNQALYIRWPKYHSFSISPSNEYSGLSSFRIDWLVWFPYHSRDSQKSSQYRDSKTSVLQRSVFFMVQLSHLYMATGKTTALTIQTFVNSIMSLLFNTLSGFVIVIPFLPRSKHLLILWLQSLSTVILEPKKIKSATVSTFSSSVCQKVMGTDAMMFVFWMLSFKPALSLSSFTFIKRLFSSSLLSAINVVLSAYLRLLIFLPTILIPTCDSSSLAFPVMYSSYELNKQGDCIHANLLIPCMILIYDSS